jgi:GT2 family glycosyltransferase
VTELSADIWVPTRGHPFYATVEHLNALTEGRYRFNEGGISVAHVRNEIVREFLDGMADVLVMIDDDVIPPGNVFEILAPLEDGFAMCGAIVLTASPGTVHMPNVYTLHEKGGYTRAPMPVDAESPVHEVSAIGAGCVAIRRDVLEGMKAPFRFKHDPDGLIVMGEDIAFCERVRKRGGKIAAHYGVVCEHYDDIYAWGLAEAYMRMVEVAANG